MRDVQLSVIVATCGRETLGDTLASITSQFRSGDEIIVYYDTSGDAGDTARNRMMPQARGTHLMFVDDDDELRPQALDQVREVVGAHRDRVVIFRVNRGLYGPQWQRRGDLWNTQTGMYVVPNVPEKLGRWGSPPGAPPGRQGDYTFITETVARLGEPVWCETVIQEIKPEKSRLKQFRYRVAARTRLRRAISRLPGGSAVSRDAGRA